MMLAASRALQASEAISRKHTLCCSNMVATKQAFAHPCLCYLKPGTCSSSSSKVRVRGSHTLLNVIRSPCLFIRLAAFWLTCWLQGF